MALTQSEGQIISPVSKLSHKWDFCLVIKLSLIAFTNTFSIREPLNE